jgi:hypothetical protein
MEAKMSFGFVGFLLVLVMGIGFASASNVIFNPTELSGSADQGSSISLSLNILNNYTTTMDTLSFNFSDLVSGSDVLDSSNLGVPQINSTTSIVGGYSLDVSLDIQVPVGQEVGIYTGEIEFFGALSSDPLSRGTINVTLVVSQPPFEFCEQGENGTLTIKNFYVDNLGNGDDDEWEPLDEIEIEVEIENDGEERVRNIVVEIMILDSSGDDVTNDFDFEEETIDLNNLDENEEDIAFFIIPEVPADLDEGSYTIYIKAYDEDDEDLTCASSSNDFNDVDDAYHTVEFSREDDQSVIIKDDDLFGQRISASCGAENIAVSLPVYNIGIDKEDKVLVNLYSFELEIDESFLIDNLKSGKRRDANFFVSLPEDLDKTIYFLDVVNYFDYDDDEDELDLFSYDLNSDDDFGENYRIRVEILDCASPEPTVTANLQNNEPVVGEEVSVNVLIRNNGNDGNFIVSLSGIDSWAYVVSVEPSSLNIAENSVGEVTLKFVPFEAGHHTFVVNSIIDGESFSQSVSVNIDEAPEAPGIFSSFGDVAGYAIIGIIALVILILLTLIAKFSRKKNPVEF